MKRRFILSIGIVLTLSLTAVGLIQYFLFRAEQFHYIDQQIETTASLLISSDLNSVELKEFEDDLKSDTVTFVTEMGTEKATSMVKKIILQNQKLMWSFNKEVLIIPVPSNNRL